MNLLYKPTGAMEQSVHRHTASSTMHTHFLERGKATDSPGISPCYMEDSYRGEIREKQVTPCLFTKGDGSSAAAIKRCVAAFTALWVG